MKSKSLTVCPINRARTMAAYRLNMSGRASVPLLSQPGSYDKTAVEAQPQFPLTKLAGIDPARSLEIVAKGPTFHVFQGDLVAMIRLISGCDYSAILLGQKPHSVSSFDSSEGVIRSFINHGLLAKLSGRKAVFPEGLYSNLIIDGPDLALSLFANIDPLVASTGNEGALGILHGMTGELFRVYWLAVGDRQRMRVSEPLNFGSLPVFNEIPLEARLAGRLNAAEHNDWGRIIGSPEFMAVDDGLLAEETSFWEPKQKAVLLACLNPGIRRSVDFAKLARIGKKEMDAVLADPSFCFSEEVKYLLKKTGWIIHIKNIDDGIFNARFSRARGGREDAAVSSALRLFQLEMNAAGLERKLHNIYIELARMFATDGVSDPDLLVFHEAVFRKINYAHGLLREYLGA